MSFCGAREGRSGASTALYVWDPDKTLLGSGATASRMRGAEEWALSVQVDPRSYSPT